MGALFHGLRNVIHSKHASVKEVQSEAVVSAFMMNKNPKSFLKKATDADCDNAMKFVFCGMERCSDPEKKPDAKHCKVFLSWHSALVERCGHGVILRAIVDKKV